MKIIKKENIKNIFNNPLLYKNNTLNLSSLTELEKIDNFAFSNCHYKIKKLILSPNLKEIGLAAFMFNEIEEIVWNDKIKIIENSAFENNLLKKIDLPKSINKISESVFANNKIEEILIDKNIKSIANDAFYNNLLTKIIINSNEIQIDNLAFYKNENIKNISIISNWNLLINEQKYNFNNINFDFVNDFHLYENEIDFYIDNEIFFQVINSLNLENIQKIELKQEINQDFKEFKFSSELISLEKNIFKLSSTTDDEILINKKIVLK